MNIDEMLEAVKKNLTPAQIPAANFLSLNETRRGERENSAAAKTERENGMPPHGEKVIDICMGIDLKGAKKVISAVEIAADIMGINVVVAVVNSAANLVALEAMDNSYIASIKAAQDKAYTAAALKMPTQTALEQSRGGALDGLSNTNGLLLLGGGEPLIKNGVIFGALGISGGSKEQDIALSKVGARIFELIL